jgi:hypothetical protein
MFKFGLISRIALLVIAIEVLAFGALGWFYIDRYSVAADEQIHARLKLVGDMIGNDELAISAIARKNLISNLLGTPYLDGYAIGGNGRVIVATEPSLLGRPAEMIPDFDMRWLDTRQTPDEHMMHGADMMTHFMRIHSSAGDTHLYTIKLTISTAELNAHKRAITQRGLLVSLIFILLSSAGIIVIAQRYVARRIDTSLQVLKAVEDGQLGARIDITSDDELGQLQDGINSMATKVGRLLEGSRQQTEKLLVSEATLQAALADQVAIFDSVTHGIAFIKDRTIIRCNRRLEEIFGYDADELLGQSTRSWYPDEAGFEAGGKIYPALAQGETHKREEYICRKDGSRLWIHMSGRSILQNDLSRGTVWVIEDITARKAAEQKLRESEELLRSSIETIGEGFVIYDPQDRLVLCNEKYLQIYQSSAPAIVPGNTFEEILRYGLAHGQYPEAVGREEVWLAERMAIHHKGDTDLTQRTDNGHWLRIREKRTPSGHIVGFRVDVTEVYRAMEAAETANRAKSEFLANMSHEIRTPMNAILGLTQLVLESPLEPRQQDFLTKAQNSGRALLGLLNDILDYSKIEAGRLEISSESFSVETVLHEVGNLFAARLAEKGLTLNFDIAANLPATVLGDALRLNQVLANLVGNAIKFTERGEIRVQVEVVNTSAVTEHAAQNDTLTLRFAVRDTGIGIDRETAHRLFQPFTQADGGITRKYGGTGLGLAICRTLVALMGGTIDATGEPGVGATFSFSIRVGRDIAHSSRSPQGKKSALAGRHFNGARILLAEDNPTNRFVMTELLKKLGITAISAHDGAAAVTAVAAAEQAKPFSAVLMDLHMPVMGGLEATRHIHALPQGARLPIIALTAAVMTEDRESCRQAGMVGFVPKPVDLQELSDVLAQHLPFSLIPLPATPTLAPAAPPDPTAVATLLERLRPYLEEHELVPDELQEALHELAQNHPSGALLTRLLRNLGDFDHDGALATLTQITVLANSA